MEPTPPGPRPARRTGRVAEWTLYFLGTIGAVSGLRSMGWLPVFFVAAVVTALRITAASRRSGARRGVALAALVPVHAFWMYLAIVFGWLLGWTVTWPMRAALLFLAVVTFVSRWRASADWRIPIVLPLGLWIGVCLMGWTDHDGVIRCDDYARFQREASVKLVVPTTHALATCKPGELLRLGRYPRRVWEAPDGRYITTLQSGSQPMPQASPVPDPIAGSVCEFDAQGVRGACLGEGKCQVILDAPKLDRVFVAGWKGGGGGNLYALSRSAPLRLVADVSTVNNVADGYYDADADEIGLIDDQAVQLTRLRASDLSELPSAPARVSPGETHYDPATHEGLFCFSPGPMGRVLLGTSTPALSVAFRGDPFSFRMIGTAPWAYVSGVWGCDFDPAGRTAWALVANLGVIAAIDYDSGRVTDVWWAEPGLRSAVFDPGRRRLYVANFLRGEVSAVDVGTGRSVQRWFAGRFVRYVGLSRDRSALLVTSNLGVVRIPLPPTTGIAHSISQLP